MQSFFFFETIGRDLNSWNELKWIFIYEVMNRKTLENAQSCSAAENFFSAMLT